ncbi:MAG TPA: hypothetical protein VGF95_13240 [Solirubrobacteraceae bacterium]|jgi:hypothetical protein
MMELLFLAVTIGTPLAICLVAVIGAHFHDGDNASLLDWQPTRSPETEARLRHRELDEMLDAVNRYRRERGAPERTLQELSSPTAAHPSRDSRRRRAGSRP